MASKLLLAFAGLLALAGCASTGTTVVGGGEIFNDTPATIYDVRVVHEPTRRVVYASEILPGHAFKLGFSPRDLQAQSAELTWRTARGQDCAARLQLPPCPPELANEPVWVTYAIHSSTSATVELTAARQ